MTFFLTLVLIITQFGPISTDKVPKVNAYTSYELCDDPFAVGTPCFMIPQIKLVKHPDTGLIVQEEWRNIKGYKGFYKVSNYGRVLSCQRVVMRGNGHPQTIHEKILAPGKLKGKAHGYYFVVMLCKLGMDKMFQIHRLVAIAFIDKVPNKPEVNHINEIKHDNMVFNLEWANHRENNTYKKKNKTSRFTGVHYCEGCRKNPWIATIVENRITTSLGNFKSETAASRVYKREINRRGLINKYLL